MVLKAPRLEHFPILIVPNHQGGGGASSPPHFLVSPSSQAFIVPVLPVISKLPPPPFAGFPAKQEGSNRGVPSNGWTDKCILHLAHEFCCPVGLDSIFGCLVRCFLVIVRH